MRALLPPFGRLISSCYYICVVGRSFGPSALMAPGIHDIHKRIDQSDFTARFPGSADSAFSSEWRCVHANSLYFVSGR